MFCRYDEHAALLGKPLNFPLEGEVQAVKLGLKRKTKSDFFGVKWSDLKQKWAAKVKVEGSRTYQGWFDTEEEAARKYDEIVAPFNKPLNFPDEAPAIGAVSPQRAVGRAPPAALDAVPQGIEALLSLLPPEPTVEAVGPAPGKPTGKPTKFSRSSKRAKRADPAADGAAAGAAGANDGAAAGAADTDDGAAAGAAGIDDGAADGAKLAMVRTAPKSRKGRLANGPSKSNFKGVVWITRNKKWQVRPVPKRFVLLFSASAIGVHPVGRDHDRGKD